MICSSFYIEDVTSPTGGSTSERVICLNADSNTITTRQTCIWNCAFYHIDKPRYVQLWFGETLVCEATGIDAETGEEIESCERKLALTRESFKECRLDNPPPY